MIVTGPFYRWDTIQVLRAIFGLKPNHAGRKGFEEYDEIYHMNLHSFPSVRISAPYMPAGDTISLFDSSLAESEKINTWGLISNIDSINSFIGIE